MARFPSWPRRGRYSQPYAINRAYAMGQDRDPCRTTDLRSLGARKGDCGLANLKGRDRVNIP